MGIYPKNNLLTFFLALVFLNSNTAAQCIVNGKIKNGTTSLPSASIRIFPINQVKIAKSDGSFSLELGIGKYQLVIEHIGYETFIKDLNFLRDTIIDIEVQLNAKIQSNEEIIVLGSRSSNRSVINSSVPIDVVKLSDLRSTGQPTLDKMLQFKLPSFNTVNVPVSDATTLIDPYEIRNLGPTRTLVLVNGKRKNSSSLVYLFGPNRGETGADLSLIPTEAIKQVEVLRDGSSAQYGSDAIAGVINIVLKNDTSQQSVFINSGVTHKGDGLFKQVIFQSGNSINKKGSVNFTIDLSQSNNATRSGTIDPLSEKASFGGTPAIDQAIDRYLAIYPTANNLNSSGSYTAGKFLINVEYPISNQSEFYLNANYSLKRSVSNANFRTPYWRTDAGLLHKRIPGGPNFTGTNNTLYEGYLGYMPTFEGDLNDFGTSFGIKTKKGIWSQDISITAGGNQQLYTLNNTINRSLGTASPTSFKAGGFSFDQLISNYDLVGKISENVSIAAGTEFRKETYNIYAGDSSSYSGEGANSFPGINIDNQSRNERYNLGIYTDLTWDIDKNLLINGTARIENYSDFGNAFVWKLSSRYHVIKDKLTVRASISTGFRAPTIHQLFYQLTTGLVSNGTVTTGGIFKNRSKEVNSLDVPELKPEQSRNYTVGIGYKPFPKMSITLDFYKIDIDRRIILSNQLSTNNTSSELYKILNQSNISSIGFFCNGINTKTEGADMVFSYGPIGSQNRKFNFSFAGNLTFKNKIMGAAIEPIALKSSGVSLLNAGIRSVIEKGRPRQKFIGGIEFIGGLNTFNLNSTFFGSTVYQDIVVGGEIMEHVAQKFRNALVSDFNYSRFIRKNIIFSLSISNIFNQKPRWNLIPLDETGKRYLADPIKNQLLNGSITFNGRYPITGISGSQFSQLGTIFQMGISFKL